MGRTEASGGCAAYDDVCTARVGARKVPAERRD